MHISSAGLVVVIFRIVSNNDYNMLQKSYVFKLKLQSCYRTLYIVLRTIIRRTTRATKFYNAYCTATTAHSVEQIVNCTVASYQAVPIVVKQCYTNTIML